MNCNKDCRDRYYKVRIFNPSQSLYSIDLFEMGLLGFGICRNGCNSPLQYVLAGSTIICAGIDGGKHAVFHACCEYRAIGCCLSLYGVITATHGPLGRRGENIDIVDKQPTRRAVPDIAADCRVCKNSTFTYQQDVRERKNKKQRVKLTRIAIQVATDICVGKEGGPRSTHENVPTQQISMHGGSFSDLGCPDAGAAGSGHGSAGGGRSLNNPRACAAGDEGEEQSAKSPHC